MRGENYPHTDKIKKLLKDKSDLIRQNGLNYLVPTWRRFADQCADTEEMVYEWLNDLDARKIIDEILASLTATDRLAIEREMTQLDELVLAKTFEVNECIWGEEAERANNYNRHKHWYYYRMNDHVFESESGRFTKRH